MSENRSIVPKQLVDFQKQLLEFQKSAFDNTFNVLETMQEQQEELITRLIEQAPALPEEGREALKTWVASYRKGREEFRLSADKSFDLLQQYFDRISGSSEPE